LVASGNALSLFHYVALLLTLGVGVNYALIVDRAATDRTHSTGVVRTLAVVSATALATFGVLALSTAPVLHAIGITVSLGVMLSLCCAALLVGTSDTSSPR
jgi:predicted exporter